MFSDGLKISEWVDRFQKRRRIGDSHVIGPSRCNPSQTLLSTDVHFCGRDLRVVSRQNSSDMELVDHILWREGEYRLPDAVQPRVIFDIGANIGITAMYFACVYPDAEIYCFEPLPENLELLEANVGPFGDRIHVMPFGLSDKSGTFDYCMSADARSFGGGGFCMIGHDRSRTLQLEVRAVSEVCAELGIDYVDVFKIDTEGSERPIIDAIPTQLRARAQAFIGELHGIDDWPCIEQLSKTHRVGVNKRFDQGCFPFIAIRPDLVESRRRAA